MTAPAPASWSPVNAMSFLNLLARVCANFPAGTTRGVDRFMVMCIAFEESRFRNIVQIGLEGRAARYDSGALRQDEIAERKIEGVAVGFTQVQLRQFDKREVVSSLGRSWEKMKFRDVTSDPDFSAAFGTRYLFMRGIRGQTNGHPRQAAFLDTWPKAAKALRDAMAGRDVEAMKAALNSAILDQANRVTGDQSELWNFLFPPDEVKTLQSDAMMKLLGL